MSGKNAGSARRSATQGEASQVKTTPLSAIKKAVFDIYLDERICPICNRPIRDNYAPSCPHCGSPVKVEKADEVPQRAKVTMWAFMAVIWGSVAVLLFLIASRGLG